MANTANEGTFTIDVKGEVTGEHYKGKFKCKLRLSHRDSIAKDNFRRNLLGPNPDEAGGRAASLAFIASELSVRILDAPKWFLDFGLDLEDDLVVSEIYKKAVELEKQALDELQKKAEEALPVVKAELEKESK